MNDSTATEILQTLPILRMAIAVALIFLITAIVRRLLYRFIPDLLARQSPLWEDILAQHQVLRYLYLSVPGLLVAVFVQFSPGLNPFVSESIYKIGIIFSTIMLTRAIVAALHAYNDFYDHYYDFANEVPIKTMIQLAVVSIVIFAILLIISFILDVPLLALAGVVMVILTIAAYLFREPLLGFSASLQLSMNHMLAIGDWIEMDKFGADGEIEDINVTSTKVRNWDNAIVNIPTYTLVQNPFNNWKTMQSRKARRVKRPIYIDQTSISFLTTEDQVRLLAQVSVLYEELPPEMRQIKGLEGLLPADLSEREQLTNLEMFMVYGTLIIAAHAQTRADCDLYMRQQDPTPQGLPVELFFFTTATEFIPYHAVQSEIVSHLLAAVPQFGLRAYQVMQGAG